MLELDHKEGWTLKHWCFWTVVLESTIESPLDFKEIKPVSPKRNQPWISIGGTDAEAEALIVWPPDAKNRLIGKDPDAVRDRGQEEKGKTEDEMVGWHHWLNGCEFGQALGDGEGQESLACCSPGVAKSWTHLSEQQQQQQPKFDYPVTNRYLVYSLLLHFGYYKAAMNIHEQVYVCFMFLGYSPGSRISGLYD